MSNQQKDDRPSGSTGGAGTSGQGLRKQDKDTTGGQTGDALSNATGAAVAGGDSGNGNIPPPDKKGGASAA